MDHRGNSKFHTVTAIEHAVTIMTHKVDVLAYIMTMMDQIAVTIVHILAVMQHAVAKIVHIVINRQRDRNRIKAPFRFYRAFFRKTNNFLINHR